MKNAFFNFGDARALGLAIFMGAALLTSCSAKAVTICVAQLSDPGAAEAFLDQFGGVISRDAKKLALEPQALKHADIIEVQGEGSFSNKKAFIVKAGEKKYWFAKSEKLGLISVARSGDLGVAEDLETFTQILGLAVASPVTSERFEFSPKDKLTRHMNGALMTEYQNFTQVLMSQGDPAAKKFIELFGTTLRSFVGTGNAKFSDFTEGRFLQAQSPVGQPPAYFTFTPTNTDEPKYLFDLRTQTVDLLVRYPARDSVQFKTYRRMNSPHHYQLEESFLLANDQVAVTENFTETRFSEKGVLLDSNILLVYLSKPSALAELRKTIVAKDAALDEYESGPYAYFAAHILTEIFKQNFLRGADVFKKLADVTIVGSGYALKDDKKTFTVFNIGKSNFYYAVTPEGIVLDNYRWGGLDDSSKLIEISWLSRYLGSKIVLPTGQLMTLSRYWPEPGSFKNAFIEERQETYEEALKILKSRVSKSKRSDD